MSCELETQPSHNLCVEAANVKQSPHVRESDRFGRFLWLQW